MVGKRITVGFVTSAETSGTLSFTRGPAGKIGQLPRRADEPFDLWPSRRGTEIAHVTAPFHRVESVLSEARDRQGWEVFDDTSRGQRSMILWGLAGERSVVLLEETALAPGILSVIADAAADVGKVRRVLRLLLRPVAQVVGSRPDSAFSS